MTPKEKAEELLNKFYDATENVVELYKDLYKDIAKACALICVEEILKSDPLTPSKFNTTVTKEEAYKESELIAYEYWIEVKEEIKKL